MGLLEADQAIIYGRIVENLRLPSPVDAYFKTIILPGFSDAHAHPQVVDGGVVGGPWRNSYEWIESRRLAVDEAAIRSDLDLASRLTVAVLKRALLEGTTLIALTGALEANIRAFLTLKARPRVVFLPTVMSKKGWPSLGQALEAARRVSMFLDDGSARVGVFLHSIKYAGSDAVREALVSAASKGFIVGMHLSEGVPESGRLKVILKGQKVPGRVVAVHCISDDPQGLGLRCAACPATNLILYRRTRKTLKGITSFGSDWPLLIGTVPRHLGIIKGVWRRRLEEILAKATLGGYRDYGMPYSGDLVAFDVSLEKVLEGSALPRLVMVGWNVVVNEGELLDGESYSDVLKEIRNLVFEALEKHPSGERVGDPLAEAEAALHDALLARHQGGIAASLSSLS